MVRRDFGKLLLSGAAVLAMALVGSTDASAQQAIKNGDILSGKLNAMRIRAAKGKRVAAFQIVSSPRRLPGPGGLCNLETGPETFQLLTSSDAEATQLKRLAGKDISVKISDVSCSQEAGQMSDAVVTKWSVVATP
jgi:hypothetical protein